MKFNGIPKGKEKNRLYEPVVMEMMEPLTGVLKELIEEAEEQFAKGEINSIDYEELRKKTKETQRY